MALTHTQLWCLGLTEAFTATTYSGGEAGKGTVFRTTTDGTLTTLESFTVANGAQPWARLALGTDGNFYGVTYAGGKSGWGTTFRVTSSGALITMANF